MLVNVSMFNSANDSRTPRSDVPLGQFLRDIRNGTYRKQVGEIRDTHDPEERRRLKATTLPAVTVGGTFRPYRHLDGMVSPSRLLPVDLDNVGNPDEAKDFCRSIYCVLHAFTSASGRGVKVIVGCAPPVGQRVPLRWWSDHFAELWSQAAVLFQERYHVDPTGSDATRLVFTSDDPLPYDNPYYRPLVYRKLRPARQTGDQLVAPRETINTSVRVFGSAAKHNIPLCGDYRVALELLEQDHYGTDKKRMMAVARNLKSNGNEFAEFAQSYARGGGTCPENKLASLWEALDPTDTDYRVVFGMARKLR